MLSHYEGGSLNSWGGGSLHRCPCRLRKPQG